jgi:hypothetical protein
MVPLALFLGMFAAAPSFPFTESKPGDFSFDTGAIKGTIRADGKSQGIVELIDVASGIDVTKKPGYPGVFSVYRLFSGSKRFPDGRSAPHRGALNENRTELRIDWEPSGDNPVVLGAVFTLTDPRSIDLALQLTPRAAAPAYELFLSSYVRAEFRHFLFVKQTIHAGAKDEPVLLEPMASPFTDGCYLAFPRDVGACRALFDGRWQCPPNPVHFAVGRHYAVPILGSRDPTSGLSFLIFARPEDCFALETTYARPGQPDSVADHNSLYLSLGGGDLAPGKPARFLLRASVLTLATHDEALKRYAAWASAAR